jgi:uncharacterized linocin/CFP29 family protein
MQPVGQDDSPLEPGEWKALTDTVVDVARRSLVARRFIDLYGPLGAGVQTVPRDEFRGTAPGVLDLIGEADTAQVFADRRTYKPLPLVYKDFLIHWRDLEAARTNNVPLDVSAAAGAAAACAYREDQLILFGESTLGEEGLLTARERTILPLRDWSQPGSAYENIVEAIEKLLSSGHAGPYAVVVPPRLFSSMNRVYEKTGILEIETIRKLATEGVHQSSLMPEQTAIVLAPGKANMDLAVAIDLSVAYLGVERMNHPFRVLESILFRIKHADAICTLEAKK